MKVTITEKKNKIRMSQIGNGMSFLIKCFHQCDRNFRKQYFPKFQ